MLRSLNSFVKTFASKGAQVASSAVSIMQKDRPFRIPARRLTVAAQLDRLQCTPVSANLDLQQIIGAQATARSALDRALYDLDHLFEGLRGIALLTLEARATVGHVATPAGSPHQPVELDDDRARGQRAA